MIHSLVPTQPTTRRRTAFKRYRVFVTQDTTCTIHKAYTTLDRALKEAAKVSVDTVYAEVRDDALTMSERLLAVYKSGTLLKPLS